MSILFKLFFVLSSMQLLVHAADFNDHELDLEKWNSFKIKFNKKYESAEEDQFRMKIYLNNEQENAKHNERFGKGEVSYRKGITKFSDLTLQEFVQQYLTNKGPISKPSAPFTSLPLNEKIPPEAKNWTAEGKVTPVKCQGSCGTCWAFSAVAAIESYYLINNGGKKKILSEQNLLDCVRKTGNVNNNCCGGSSINAFKYVKSHGIVTEKSYPYDDKNNACWKKVSKNENVTTRNSIGRLYHFQKLKNSCNESLPKAEKVTIKNHRYFNRPGENEMKKIVGLIGPVISYINATKLHSYHTGDIVNGEDCPNGLHQNNHEVLIVGYGTAKGKDYWLAKNSWGVNWGDYGYFRIARNSDNTCGIANYIVYPEL